MSQSTPRSIVKYSFFAILFLLFLSCELKPDKMPQNIMYQLEAFKKKDKFLKEANFTYPGISTPELRTVLETKINMAADDFREAANSNAPNEELYQVKIGVALKRFEDVYLETDTEDRERICTYFEELMDIFGLKSSNGQLNEFMYGFDPTELIHGSKPTEK
ncbi:DUF4844 domain-containing protein [Hymenobacter lucidus]|uniref:DUF4844 domain-containing protein n=1 Tax=Hymenobacter lucidus TaxID=2880930 RepID=A0ABS8AQY7_9BACT|nr:DUF4844 domain-containing protein [Hymenobacter lucidus]MCB2408154.1 DUF4844 domain-containing protein [Hymenobacter lucidus]